jgi:restriction endonuclease S subunit
MNLDSLCDISTGLTLRGKPAHGAAGKYVLLQLGDIHPAGHINTQSATITDGDASYAKFVTSAGDLVFRGRGAGIGVAIVPDDGRNYVASAPLIVLRPYRHMVDPPFLAKILTSDLASAHFSKFTQGSIITGIGIADLRTLDVPLPDMETQKKIGDLAQLQKREQELLISLHKAKHRLINNRIEAMVVGKARKQDA